ncbi:MAG: hypothetical protein IIA70_09130 [Proteobacteria bacterium]|nr:hypothetical protein [Pseudomonadota bacterium]
MKTVFILARTLSSAMQALHRNLESQAFEEDFISFRFIATADQVKSLPRNQTFLVVRKWRDRPDADEIIEAMKERDWQSISLKDVFLG